MFVAKCAQFISKFALVTDLTSSTTTMITKSWKIRLRNLYNYMYWPDVNTVW